MKSFGIKFWIYSFRFWSSQKYKTLRGNCLIKKLLYMRFTIQILRVWRTSLFNVCIISLLFSNTIWKIHDMVSSDRTKDKKMNHRYEFLMSLIETFYFVMKIIAFNNKCIITFNKMYIHIISWYIIIKLI